MRTALLKFASDQVLATAPLGKRVFLALVSEIHPPNMPTVLYLDFAGVEVATVSFLREAIVTFRNHVRTHVAHLYPVVANLSPAVKEELEGFLRDKADAMAACQLTSDEQVSGAEVIGQLDGKQLLTLAAAVNADQIDAAALQQQFAAEESVGITAWNNRLAALSAKGLLVETSIGRAKRYRVVLENLKYGR